MKIEIKHRWTGNVLYACNAENMREAVEKAAKAGANLAGANLAGANLARANLAGANLADAYLVGAYLVGANLVGANLARANLAGANLADAYLVGAYLVGANLVGANLADANLAGEKLAIAPIQIYGLYWNVLITESYMKIGCQRHTHDEWEGFTPDKIETMHESASKFWNANRLWLLVACKQHAAESKAYRLANPEKFAEAL